LAKRTIAEVTAELEALKAEQELATLVREVKVLRRQVRPSKLLRFYRGLVFVVKGTVTVTAWSLYALIIGLAWVYRVFVADTPVEEVA
jgi:hypothetical protein